MTTSNSITPISNITLFYDYQKQVTEAGLHLSLTSVIWKRKGCFLICINVHLLLDHNQLSSPSFSLALPSKRQCLRSPICSHSPVMYYLNLHGKEEIPSYDRLFPKFNLLPIHHSLYKKHQSN